jgi:hypothetical protein
MRKWQTSTRYGEDAKTIGIASKSRHKENHAEIKVPKEPET